MPCSRAAQLFDLLKMGQGHDLFLRLKFRGKFVEDLFWFFGKHLRGMSLVSRGSVLGKSVDGLGFFLCPGPRVLDSTSG